MPSPEFLDFQRLLAPISEDQPSGAELRDDASLSANYYQVKDAREAARSAERQVARSKWATEEEKELNPVESPDWGKVQDLAVDTISTKSKDLWIAAWLTESLARLHGFAGLRDGFRLVRELTEHFWDDIHPRPDEDGYATTVAQLTGLNGEDSEGALIAPINNIPITEGTSVDPLTSTDYIDASELEQIADAGRRQKRIEQGAVSLEEFEKAVRETSPEFFRGLLDDISQAIQEFTKLTEVLESKCKTDEGRSLAPPSSAISNTLQACRDRVESLARHVLQGDGQAESENRDVAEEAPSELLPVDGHQQRAQTVEGKVQTREDAFGALLQVADYFHRTEPHSPVSYALKQVVRWGRMSLPELMAELISDENVREDMFRRTGISSPSTEDTN